MIHSKKRITKALIRLRGCSGWSAAVLFANYQRQVFFSGPILYLYLFPEWVEFSPYEIGMAKYGTFMKTELFGSKFFMGKLCKDFEEPPLHFLQGKE